MAEHKTQSEAQKNDTESVAGVGKSKQLVVAISTHFNVWLVYKNIKKEECCENGLFKKICFSNFV